LISGACMAIPRSLRLWLTAGAIVVAAAAGAALLSARDPGSGSVVPARTPGTATVERRDFVRTIRLSGTVEAVESTTITAPRLSGPSNTSLVITKLVPAGATVRAGDLIVEFDRQTQLAEALNRRAALDDLEHQIRKREAAERTARVADEGEIQIAESTLERAARGAQERLDPSHPGGEE